MARASAAAARQPDASTSTSTSASLLDLYRAAQRLQAQAFGAFALDWLGARISFEKSVIVTTFEKHASWVDAHFSGIENPRALMASHEKVRHLDIFTPRMFATPNVAARVYGGIPELAGPRFAPFREHLIRFGGWHEVTMVVPSTEHHTATVLIACRDEHASAFTNADVATMQELGPHIAEAASVNRTIWLPRTATGALPVASLDKEGRLLQTTAAFIRLFWPHAPPPSAYLPDAILKTIHKRKPWPLPDGAHSLYGEPDETGGWQLRIRTTSPLDQLTAREREVATLFAHGTSYKTIATKLGLSPTTVRNHLQNLYSKLGVTQRDELLALISKR